MKSAIGKLLVHGFPFWFRICCVMELILFLFGGYGAFDRLAAAIVWEQREKYRFQSILVKPYPDRDMDESLYHCTLYPALEKVPRRYAIVKRNQWMVEASDVVVAYVLHSWGGAAKTMEYAKKKGKPVLLYPSLE